MMTALRKMVNKIALAEICCFSEPLYALSVILCKTSDNLWKTTPKPVEKSCYDNAYATTVPPHTPLE